MLWTANKIRGRTILADAFFPLAILNVGQINVFLWWWQVNHVLASILATVLLSVLIVRSEQLRLADVRWVAVSLIVLVLCGPGGLPYVAVFATWLAVWIAANWRAFSPRERQQSVWVFMPTLIALALMSFYFMNYTPHFPVNDPPRMSYLKMMSNFSAHDFFKMLILKTLSSEKTLVLGKRFFVGWLIFEVQNLKTRRFSTLASGKTHILFQPHLGGRYFLLYFIP